MPATVEIAITPGCLPPDPCWTAYWEVRPDHSGGGGMDDSLDDLWIGDSLDDQTVDPLDHQTVDPLDQMYRGGEVESIAVDITTVDAEVLPDINPKVVPEIASEAIAGAIMENTTECFTGVCGVEQIASLQTALNIPVGTDPVDTMAQAIEKTSCDTQMCVWKSAKASIRPADYSDVMSMFKPVGPAKSFDWLSNFDIDTVLQQFETVFPGFRHVPYKMRDTVDRIPLEELRRALDTPGKAWGCVVNTDRSSGQGIHWFALYGEYSTRGNITIEYFNSSGEPPLSEVADWIARAEVFWRKSNVVPVDRIRVHRSMPQGGVQRDGHSCGVWSIFYIWSRLVGVAPDWFRSENVTDAHMQWLRGNLFRHGGKAKN